MSVSARTNPRWLAFVAGDAVVENRSARKATRGWVSAVGAERFDGFGTPHWPVAPAAHRGDAEGPRLALDVATSRPGPLCCSCVYERSLFPCIGSFLFSGAAFFRGHSGREACLWARSRRARGDARTPERIEPTSRSVKRATRGEIVHLAESVQFQVGTRRLHRTAICVLSAALTKRGDRVPRCQTVER